MTSTPLTSLLTAFDPRDHPGRIIERIMASARDDLGLEVSFVSEFVGGQRVFRYVGGDLVTFDVRVEDSQPLEQTYCQRIVEGTMDPLVKNAVGNPTTRDLPVTESIGIGSYVGVPLGLSDGRVYGTLCCLSRDPNDELSQRDVTYLRMAADLVAEQLEREELVSAERQQAIQRVRSVLDGDGLIAVYQPIVRLVGGAVVGVEALSRFARVPERGPQAWFDEAWAVGLGAELELAAVQRALSGLNHVPAGTYLALNLSPETLLSPVLDDVFARVAAERLVVEITEHARVLDYEPVKTRLNELRRLGLRIAIDDLGTGYAGIKHLVEFPPDILKLDLTVVRGVRKDPVRRTLAATFATFAAHLGADIVAEGIESAEDMEALEILGVTAGQGFHIAEPAPLADLDLVAAERRRQLGHPTRS